jgi:hypothetical protein
MVRFGQTLGSIASNVHLYLRFARKCVQSIENMSRTMCLMTEQPHVSRSHWQPCGRSARLKDASCAAASDALKHEWPMSSKPYLCVYRYEMYRDSISKNWLLVGRYCDISDHDPDLDVCWLC